MATLIYSEAHTKGKACVTADFGTGNSIRLTREAVCSSNGKQQLCSSSSKYFENDSNTCTTTSQELGSNSDEIEDPIRDSAEGPTEVVQGEYFEEDMGDETQYGEFGFIEVPEDDATVLHVPKSEEQSAKRRWSMFSLFGWSSSDTPQVTVRNTFLDIEAEKPALDYVKFVSAPSVMLTQEFSTKYPLMDQAHIAGECRPCAYFVKFNDGDACRWGGDCTFCHLCPPGVFKRKKKEKVKALRKQEWLAKQATLAQEAGI
jgi:hypothetical protein